MTALQNAKDILKLLVDAAKTTDQILEDKKVTLQEAMQYIPTVLAVPSAIPKFQPAADELTSADDEAQREFIEYAEQILVLRNEQTENLIEDLIGFLTYGARLFNRFTKRG